MNRLIRKLNRMNGWEIHLPIKYLLFIAFLAAVSMIFWLFLFNFLEALRLINLQLFGIAVILMAMALFWDDFIKKLLK